MVRLDGRHVVGCIDHINFVADAVAFLRARVLAREVEGVGRLRVKVRDSLKRTWGRDTRLEHEQKGLPGRTPQLSGKYAKTA